MTGPYSVRPWWSRREFLKSSVAVAAGAYGLSPSFAMAAPVPEKFDGSAFKLKAPEPNAKSGGVLRHGMPLRAPHFDIHQAGTIFILGAAACMFDNLIRRDPNDGAKTMRRARRGSTRRQARLLSARWRRSGGGFARRPQPRWRAQQRRNRARNGELFPGSRRVRAGITQ
jgi:hypothetical protein